jgi:hypothetical protein
VKNCGTCGCSRSGGECEKEEESGLDCHHGHVIMACFTQGAVRLGVLVFVLKARSLFLIDALLSIGGDLQHKNKPWFQRF